MPHSFTENQLAKQPAVGLFRGLGWQVAEPPPPMGVAAEPHDGGLLGWETKGEVVLAPRMRAALEQLNPSLRPEALAGAMDELQLLVLIRRQKSAVTSQVKLAIEDVLDTGLPRAYDKPLYEQKCAALFEHIFESYPEKDAGVYAAAQ